MVRFRSRSWRWTASSMRPTSRSSSRPFEGCMPPGHGGSSSTSPACASWRALASSRCTRSSRSCTGRNRSTPRAAGRRCTASVANSKPTFAWPARSPRSIASSSEPGSTGCSSSTPTGTRPSTRRPPLPDGVPGAAMTTEAAPQLDLDAVVAPFRGLEPVICLSIEASDGTPIASTSLHPPTPDTITREIAGGALAGGRIRVWGSGSGGGLGTAVAESLAAALAAAPVTDLAVAAQQAANARRIEEELAHGRRLQRSFVSLTPPDVPGYDISAHYEAAREVGGDFFDLFRLRKRGRPLSVTIADVTGKGIAAALLMAFVRPLLHAAIDHTTGPAQALERTNRILVEERRSSLFITALVGRLDLPTGRLTLANAGHEPPLIVRADGSPPVWLDGAGP